MRRARLVPGSEGPGQQSAPVVDRGLANADVPAMRAKAGRSCPGLQGQWGTSKRCAGTSGMRCAPFRGGPGRPSSVITHWPRPLSQAQQALSVPRWPDALHTREWLGNRRDAAAAAPASARRSPHCCACRTRIAVQVPLAASHRAANPAAPCAPVCIPSGSRQWPRRSWHLASARICADGHGPAATACQRLGGPAARAIADAPAIPAAAAAAAAAA
jgi:hypothetical protein